MFNDVQMCWMRLKCIQQYDEGINNQFKRVFFVFCVDAVNMCLESNVNVCKTVLNKFKSVLKQLACFKRVYKHVNSCQMHLITCSHAFEM